MRKAGTHEHRGGLDKHESGSRAKVKRISMSLPPALLSEFDRSMNRAGFSDRSKAIQTALHSFVDNYEWSYADDSQDGAGVIMLLYDNHRYNQDSAMADIQHKFNEVIGATTHLHLDHENCLEAIMVRGQVKRIKELARRLSENRGIKSLKVNFVTIV